MNFKPYKQNAKEIIRNNKMLMLYAFICVIVLFICNFICSKIPVMGFIGTLVISLIFSLVMIGVSLQIVNGENIDLNKIFSKFGKFVKAELWYLLYSLPAIIGYAIFIGCFLGLLLLGFATFLSLGDVSFSGILLVAILIVGLWSFVFSIIWSISIYFKYSFSLYISVDDAAINISAKNCLKVSKEMMKGNKFRFFVFQLSFIGWYLLVGLTLGIMSVYVIPYIQLATAEFYEDLKNQYNNRE